MQTVSTHNLHSSASKSAPNVFDATCHKRPGCAIKSSIFFLKTSDTKTQRPLRILRRHWRILVHRERVALRLVLSRRAAQLIDRILVLVRPENCERVSAHRVDEIGPLALPQRLGRLNIILKGVVVPFSKSHELQPIVVPLAHSNIAKAPVAEKLS